MSFSPRDLRAGITRAKRWALSQADQLSDRLEPRITSVRPGPVPTGLGVRGRMSRGVINLATWASRATGQGSGGMIGGMVAAALDPMVMARLNRGRPVVLVTGTNGKSTTTSMLTAALGTQFRVATNDGGNNMDAGVVSALHSGGEYEVAALEVDEMHVPAIAKKLQPAAMILLNLSRDQLDRVGEINLIERTLRQAINSQPQMTVIANCDDVMVTSAAWDHPRTIWVAAGCGWKGESTSCPRTGGAIIRRDNDAATTSDSHRNDIACGASDSRNDSAAGTSTIHPDAAATGTSDWYARNPLPDGSEFRRPAPDFQVTDAGVVITSPRGAALAHLPEGTTLPLNLAVPGRANRGNATLALVAALAAGASDTHAALAATEQVRAISGRYAEYDLHGRRVRMFLAKNPAGWQESLSMVDRTADGVVIATNGQVADGVDLSWIWDVRFENLDELEVIASGERGQDLAVRLGYAGVEHQLVKDPIAAICTLPAGSRVQVLANYTSFRDIKRVLDRDATVMGEDATDTSKETDGSSRSSATGQNLSTTLTPAEEAAPTPAEEAAPTPAEEQASATVSTGEGASPTTVTTENRRPQRADEEHNSDGEHGEDKE